jgi:hypothetical protein
MTDSPGSRPPPQDHRISNQLGREDRAAGGKLPQDRKEQAYLRTRARKVVKQQGMDILLADCGLDVVVGARDDSEIIDPAQLSWSPGRRGEKGRRHMFPQPEYPPAG